MQQNVEDSLAKGTTPATPATPAAAPEANTVGGKNTSQKGGDDKQAIREVADLILKLCGNTSILITVLWNLFLTIWHCLSVSFKKYLTPGSVSDGLGEDHP